MELDQWEWDHGQGVAEASARLEPGSFLGQTGTAEEQVAAVFRGEAVAAECSVEGAGEDGIILLRFGNRQLIRTSRLEARALSRKLSF